MVEFMRTFSAYLESNERKRALEQERLARARETRDAPEQANSGHRPEPEPDSLAGPIPTTSRAALLRSEAGSRKGSQVSKSSASSSMARCLSEIKESVGCLGDIRRSVDQLKQRMERVEVRLDAPDEHPARSSMTSTGGNSG